MKLNFKNISKRIFGLLLMSTVIISTIGPIKVKAINSTNIYVVWDCENKVCVSDAITVNNGVEGAGGIMSYEVNYIKASDVVDTTRNETLNPSAVTGFGRNETHWYIYEDVTGLNTYENWEDFDIAIHEDEYPLGIDPTGGNDGYNSLVHNGDRKYRVVIYDDSKFESLTFNVNADNYTYYLGAWDPVFSNPTYDVSGTTKEKPAEYTTYLLEDTLKFSAGTINKEAITSVKALDVPSKAVTISKDNNGEYTVKFKSNYYSEVILEVTGAQGGKYYIKINRTFLKVANNMMDLQSGESNTPQILARFIYPATTAYTDYDVIATITKKSGATEIKKLTSVKYKEWDNIQNQRVAKYVWDAGENLKETSYAINVSKDDKEIQVTVTSKDAISNSTYGGTFGGHGRGVVLEPMMVTRFVTDAFSIR